jgi:hypothetical protein
MRQAKYPLSKPIDFGSNFTGTAAPKDNIQADNLPPQTTRSLASRPYIQAREERCQIRDMYAHGKQFLL